VNDRTAPVSSASEYPINIPSEVVVGMVRGAWGIRGHVKVEPLTNYPGRFSPDSCLYLNGQPVKVIDSRPHKDILVVKFDRVKDRSQAESLREAIVTIPISDVEPLPPGSFYHFQVLGIGAWTEDGEYVGRVTQILPKEGADVYVIQHADGAEVLLPALKSVVVEINPEKGRMVVRLRK